MKIGLITVPFNNNYGGFLQAFALKTYIESKGHDVTIINRRRNIRKKNNIEIIKYIIKKKIKYILFGKEKDISIHTNRFVHEYLSPITDEIYSTNELKKECYFDFYIVGSDQVWRYKYAPNNITNYFFDFLEGTNKPRISYAASFGVSYNEYDEHTIAKCSYLLKEFKAISVRESSGINLLNNVFSVETEIFHVLDPTMLIDKKIYHQLANKFPIDDKFIFTYILDRTEDKQLLINKISKERELPVKNINAQTGNNKSIIDPVEKWISYISNASYVITDSFHGMVFSIIFNKPFVVYINRERGAERFESLLSLFEIEDSLIEYSDDYKDIQFNWDKINQLLNIYREKSQKYLDKSLL